jgi:pyridoxine 4-dehydrogenase
LALVRCALLELVCGGEALDRAEAIRTLKRLPDLGVDFVDTPDSYGPDVSEILIREALHPYRDILVATKAGLTRPGPDVWTMSGRPEYLIRQAEKSLRNLGVEQIGLWQLYRIDPNGPRDDQFGAVKALLDKGMLMRSRVMLPIPGTSRFRISSRTLRQ